MIRVTVLEILKEVWPMILIFSTVLISLRVTWLIQNRQKFVLYKELLMLFFVIYILCLFYVVTFQDVSWSTSNFIPFKEMFRYEIGSRLFIKNVIGNMMMFLPYGFFLSYFIKLKKPWSIFLLTLLCSATIETTQLLIGRVFDIDDMILNLGGSLIGFFGYHFIHRFIGLLPEPLKKDWIYNILIIILMVLVGLYFFNIIQLGV